MGVSQVLGLLEVEGLCRRFELQPDEVELLRAWFADAQIHWGLDDEHRAGLGLPGRQGTWLEGSSGCCSATPWAMSVVGRVKHPLRQWRVAAEAVKVFV